MKVTRSFDGQWLDWDVEKQKMVRMELVEILRDVDARITFTKVNGETRVINATLREEVVPETKDGKKKNDSVLAVYDLDKQAWRSFRVGSVRLVEYEVDRDVEAKWKYRYW